MAAGDHLRGGKKALPARGGSLCGKKKATRPPRCVAVAVGGERIPARTDPAPIRSSCRNVSPGSGKRGSPLSQGFVRPVPSAATPEEFGDPAPDPRTAPRGSGEQPETHETRGYGGGTVVADPTSNPFFHAVSFEVGVNTPGIGSPTLGLPRTKRAAEDAPAPHRPDC